MVPCVSVARSDVTKRSYALVFNTGLCEYGASMLPIQVYKTDTDMDLLVG